MTVRAVTAGERRDRLGRRHLLCGPAGGAGPVAVADALVAYHATDPTTVFLSAWARVPGFEVADLEAALYDDETLTKQLGMRRTLFVVAADVLPLMQAACTDAIAANERRRLEREVEKAGIAPDGRRWLHAAEHATLAALDERGPSTGQQLSRAVPEIQAKFRYAEDKPYGGEVGVAGRVFTILAAEGRIRRARPSGSWTSSQHRWEAVAEPSARLPEVEARTELVARWLRAFGPAPLTDLAWWTGLGVTKVRHALDRLVVVEVDLEGEVGLLLADDVEPEPAAPPWVALLPSLDPTTMGWQRREWYLGPHASALFDRNGNAGPTVWCDGRVVGGWAQRPSGDVAFRLLEDVGREAAAAIAAKAAALEAWLGKTSVTPRFPTPLGRELRG